MSSRDDILRTFVETGEIASQTLVTSWDRRFIELALLVSSWSKDPERQVGAVIVDPLRRVVSVGFNGFPRGALDIKERLDDPEVRNLMTMHAEVNAVLNTASGAVTSGSTLYATSFPCAGCAGVIVQAGLRRVVCPGPEMDSGWTASWDVARTLFREGGVTTTELYF